MVAIRDKGFDNIKLVSLSEEASQEITSNFLRPAGLRRSAFAAHKRLAKLGGREPGGSRSPPLRAGLGLRAQLPPLCAAGEGRPSRSGWEALRLPDPPRCHQSGFVQAGRQRARGREKVPVESLREAL